MIAFARALLRLVVACLAIIATVLFAFGLVAAIVWLLVWIGVP